MYRVEIELSASRMKALGIASWIAATLTEELATDVVVHRISVEQADA